MIPYIGGKKKMQSWIIPNINKDIEIYCEPFAGQFWIFFGMELEQYPNLKKIVYNDLNPLNYNLFQCVRDPKRLLDECNKLVVQEKGVYPTNPICKEMFDSFQSEIFNENFSVKDYDYETAAKYAYVLTQVFSGANPAKSKFIDLKGKYHSKFTAFKNKLSKPDWVDHFSKISDVENLDFQKVINKYDSQKTYFYVDPPYYVVGEGSYYSNHDFDRQDHERLVNVLKDIKGEFSLSYYDFPLLSEWLPKDEYRWIVKEFVKGASAKKGEKQNIGQELLIMKY